MLQCGRRGLPHKIKLLKNLLFWLILLIENRQLIKAYPLSQTQSPKTVAFLDVIEVALFLYSKQSMSWKFRICDKNECQGLITKCSLICTINLELDNFSFAKVSYFWQNLNPTDYTTERKWPDGALSVGAFAVQGRKRPLLPSRPLVTPLIKGL